MPLCLSALFHPSSWYLPVSASTSYVYPFISLLPISGIYFKNNQNNQGDRLNSTAHWKDYTPWHHIHQCRRHGFNPWSGKIPHGHGATNPIRHNYWALHACAPQEKPLQWEALALQLEKSHIATKAQQSQKLLNHTRDGHYLNIIIVTYEKHIGIIISNDEILPLRSGTKQGCSLSLFLFNKVLEVLPRTTRPKKKEIKGIQIGKGGAKLYLFADDIMLYVVLCCLVVKLYETLLQPHWTVDCQAPLSIGFPRKEYWSALPFPSPGDLPDQRSNPCLLC